MSTLSGAIHSRLDSMRKHANLPCFCAAIGVFDGVHRAHQRILNKLVKQAKQCRIKSLLITFNPHPRLVLNPDSKIPFLTSFEHRLRLICDSGVDYIYIINFTKKIAMMEPEDFIRKILIERLRIKALVVGKNFMFGKYKRGNFALLKKMSKVYKFRLFGVEPVKMKRMFISSTRIRQAIEKGDLNKASKMLARPVTILGRVVKGRSIGRRIGFPTANINPHHEAIPPSGVYSVNVRFNNKEFRGVLNIGVRPTFGKEKTPTIELHIINFKKDIYGKDVEIIFKKKIRNEKTFDSVKDLQKQISKDIQRAAPRYKF